MRTLLRATGVAAAVLLLLASCGNDDEPVSAGNDGSAVNGDDDLNSIEGEYVSTAVEEGGQAKDLVGDTTIRLRLSDGALSASAGCNTIGGDYSIDDQVLHVGAMSTTEMGCDPPRHEQDQWLADVLSASPTLEPVEEGFVLRAGEVAITFVDHSVVDPDRDLVGTTWEVDGYVDGAGPDGAVSSPAVGGETARVVFEDNGFVTGHDGCNGFGFSGPSGEEPTDGLSYEVDGDTITFSGAAASTQIACPGLDTDRFWAVLSGTVTWSIDGSALTLSAPDGRGLIFRAEA